MTSELHKIFQKVKEIIISKENTQVLVTLHRETLLLGVRKKLVTTIKVLVKLDLEFILIFPAQLKDLEKTRFEKGTVTFFICIKKL